MIFHSFPPITCFSFSLFDVYCLFTFHLFFAWASSTLIETHSVFVFTLSLPPSPPPPPLYSHPHIDKQPVKVKRKKSFNLSRKFPFYKSKENIVQELVESEREYQLCDRWGWAVVFLLLSPSCFSSVSQLSSFRSPPGMVCVPWHHSHPFLTVPERCPTCRAGIRLETWGSLWCVCASVCGLQRSVQLCVCCQLCVCAWCVCTFLTALTHGPSNTMMLLLV